MLLLQPAIYGDLTGNQWVKFADVLDISKRKFGMEPASVWSDIKEWEAVPGFVWMEEDMTLHISSLEKPKKFDQIYIPYQVATKFFTQASNGIRNVRFDSEKQAHHFEWAKSS
ncbi:MAG TPA: hypothetical protein VLG69_01290 [Candidatus Andersenbacteria bacterium]|nr:hypothetical protein [Candidatus Andersenbacteria bacterium]